MAVFVQFTLDDTIKSLNTVFSECRLPLDTPVTKVERKYIKLYIEVSLIIFAKSKLFQ